MKTNILTIVAVIFFLVLTVNVNAQEKKKAISPDSIPATMEIVEKEYLKFVDGTHPGLHNSAWKDGKYQKEKQYRYTGLYASVKGGYSPDHGALGSATFGVEWGFGRLEAEAGADQLTFDEIDVTSMSTGANFILDLNKSKLVNAYVGIRAGYIYFNSAKSLPEYDEPFEVKAHSFRLGAMAGVDFRITKDFAMGIRGNLDNFDCLKYGESIKMNKFNAEVVLTYRFGRR